VATVFVSTVGGSAGCQPLRPPEETPTEEASDKHDEEGYQQHPKRQLDRTPDAEGENQKNEQEKPDHGLDFPGVPLEETRL
jgi:hypothetical protein